MIQKKSLNQWLKTLETKHNKKIDLGLDRVSQVYERLAIKKIAPVIFSVAGTNGKGSTVAILSSICQQAGYKVGEFTSPHISQYNERIKINSQNCSDEKIIKAFELIEQNLNGITLSYFEYATLAAAIIFKQQKVDVAILEVGLGGRLDSVNVIDTDCAIITTIAIDHTEWLGDTVEKIGFEKAGIMRSNTPSIYGDNNCPTSIINHAKSLNSTLIFATKTVVSHYEKPRLNGDYQVKNSTTAITAIKALKSQLKINDADINKGLDKIKLSGRLQIISTNPNVIVDVSHNKQAALSLNQWLKDNPIDGQTFAVFAVLKDKNPMDWLCEFDLTIDGWCISQVKSARAFSTDELLKVLADSAKLIMSFKSVENAFKKAKSLAKKKDRLIVFGSFYTVSEVMQ